MGEERRVVLFSGRVQGVGFRWTASRALRGCAVTGYVRNLPDGRVELVVEGAPVATGEAVRRIQEVLSDNIDGAQESIEAPTGEFAAFGIRR